MRLTDILPETILKVMSEKIAFNERKTIDYIENAKKNVLNVNLS